MPDKKILLVDDDEDILELLCFNFKKLGYEVQTAAGGKKAIETIAWFKPDIIISDILMPEFSGIKMCRYLKSDERYKNIPVVFLSAADDDIIALGSIEAGAATFLSKPLHLPLLFNVVKDHLAVPRPTG